MGREGAGDSPILEFIDKGDALQDAPDGGQRQPNPAIEKPPSHSTASLGRHSSNTSFSLSWTRTRPSSADHEQASESVSDRPYRSQQVNAVEKEFAFRSLHLAERRMAPARSFSALGQLPSTMTH